MASSFGTFATFILVLITSQAWANSPRGSQSDLSLSGNLYVAMAAFELPNASVQALLPQGLELVDGYGPSGYHAVTLMFGEQGNVHANSGILYTPISKFYLEFTIAVAGVQLSSSVTGTGKPAGPFTHLVKLYLDDWGAIWVGRWPFGYNKFYGDTTTDRLSYTTLDAQTGETVVSATIANKSIWNQPTFYQNLTNLIAGFPTVYVAKRADGRWVCSQIIFSVDKAEFSPVQLNINLGADLQKLFGSKSISAPGLDESPVGAFRMNSQWQGSPATDCY